MFGSRRSVQRARTPFVLSVSLHALLFVTGLFNIFIMKAPEDATTHFTADIVTNEAKKKPQRRVQPLVKPLVKPLVLSATPRAASSYIDVPATVADVPFTPWEPSLAAASGTGPTALAPAARGASEVRELDVATFRPAAFSPAPPRVEMPTLATAVLDARIEYAQSDPTTPVARLSGSVMAPRFLQRVVPEYPETARRSSKEGVVILTAVVLPSGLVDQIDVEQSLGMGCDEAAIAALRASRFFPAYEDGSPVSATIRVPYRFRIGDGS